MVLLRNLFVKQALVLYDARKRAKKSFRLLKHTSEDS